MSLDFLGSEGWLLEFATAVMRTFRNSILGNNMQQE